MLCAAGLLASHSIAQPPPPAAPGPPSFVPLDPARQRGLEEQQAAFLAYQKCVAEHRKEVDLHNAARQILDFRSDRAALEKAMQADPGMRQRFPGGMDQVLTQAFAQYKSLGGTAASVAEVSELPNPCPPPRPQLVRSPPATASAAISERRQLAVTPGAIPPRPAAQPPRTFTPAAAPPLRKALEQAWLAHIVAVGSGIERELEKTMSSYYFVTTRNNLARAGRTLTPESVVELGRFYPDLNTTTFVTVIEKGPTAALVHARDAARPDSTGEPRVDYFFLRFADEGRGWKADAFAIINAAKYRADGSPAPFSLPANPSPVYRIDGQIRPAPAPIAVAR